MQRRALLKVGLAGGALLAAAGGASWLLRRGGPDAATSEDTRTVVRSVLPALLAGALPAAPDARTRALEAALARTLATITDLPRPTRNELGQLFALLASAPGRWLAGIDRWDDADPAQVGAWLQRWRTHTFDLYQSAYHALHDLVLGSYYADPATWPAIGYRSPVRP